MTDQDRKEITFLTIVAIIIIIIELLTGCAFPSYLKDDKIPTWTDYIDKHELKGGKHDGRHIKD